VAKYYRNSVGDSPELARGLDSYGFSDLEVFIKFHVAITSALKHDEPKKFQLGTPKQVWSCISCCWELCKPTSKRIVQDIEGLPDVLEKIIVANGCVVSGDDVHFGHHAQRHDGMGPRTTRLRNNQRKNSQFQRPIQPDAQASYEALVDHDNEHIVYPVNDVASDILDDDVMDE